MIQIISRARARVYSSLLGGFVALSIASPAYAAGSSMPWEAPLQSILESIQGPVAKIMAVIIIIATGLTLAFGDSSGGFRRLIQIVFGLSIAFAASSFFLSFFWSVFLSFFLSFRAPCSASLGPAGSAGSATGV